MPPRKVTRSSHTAWSLADFELPTSPSTLRLRHLAHALRHRGQHHRHRQRRCLHARASQCRPQAARHRRADHRGRPPREVTLALDATLPSTAATPDWEEHAFSWARGWPVCACFHQDRLVLGGSRDLPNRLWLSRTGIINNFDAGTGLDDEAIEFSLMSDQVNAIRGLFSGRHLQVFTSGAEWMVTGDPLTPSSIQLHRQTRIGSPVERMVPPVDVDGATVFVARSGRGVHEFAYYRGRAAYQASDLALVARTW
jgi:hypothetical protein